jgi:spermidine synthase
MGMARRFRESTRANYVLLVAGIVLFLSSSIYLTVFPLGSSQGSRFGNVIYEATSDYAQIRVREKGTVRSLLFLDRHGVEQCQSSIDLAAPGTSQLRYAKGLFSSFLFRHPQKRILIVGLGAGGMVRYLNHNFPEMMVEAVEIDPVVVAVAAEYFQTVPGPKTVLHTADAFAFFNDDHGLYDAIYMDAFLRPPADVTLEEKAKRLKTEAFLHELKSHLLPGGVIAFNLIEWEEGTPDDLAAIRTVFPETYLFGVPQSGNLAVIATTRDPAPSREELAETAVLLNRNAPADLDFSELVENLRE